MCNQGKTWGALHCSLSESLMKIWKTMNAAREEYLKDWDASVERTGKASSSAALPWSLSAERQRVSYLLTQPAHTCHQCILLSAPLPTWLTLPSPAHGLFCLLTAIYSLRVPGIAGRHVVVPFQALLTCLFFNETSLEKARCAGSLYFTDFSSTGLSSLFKNISNCHCIYHRTDRYFLPLLPLQYFYTISADTMTLFAKASGLKTNQVNENESNCDPKGMKAERNC